MAAVVLTASGLTLVGGIGASPAGAQMAGPWDFDYTAGPQSFTVPAGVTKLSMIVVGAAGGESDDNLGGAAGGVSGLTWGQFAVTPGDVLTIWVGGGGAANVGGWGFGCAGWGGLGDGLTAENGGGGGGSSAVSLGAFSAVPGDCSTRPAESALLAVGGGGGGGGANEFVPPPQPGISTGGVGGDGGNPAGAGATGGFISPGGCGGCMNEFNGQAGAPNPANGGGAGGGGGGYRGGAGGGVAIEDGGGGGGGGRSFLGSSAADGGYIAGYGSGDGHVTLSALGTEFFQCTGGPQSTTVPADAGQLQAHAEGGHGGSRGATLGGPGGAAGTADATVDVNPGDAVTVSVGCQGTRNPGWGYGSGGGGGGAPAPYALDGAGGGGSSGVVVAGNRILIAGGGGAGGGSGETFGQDSDGSGGVGGTGGNGGMPGGSGTKGAPDDYAGGDGGQGGVEFNLDGGGGDTAGHGSLGGGGGGGGAGWLSGDGGHAGRLDITLVGGGGGGGGGGMSGVAAGAIDFSYGTSVLSGDGLVELTFLPPGPAAISAYGGSKQQTTIGSGFAQPLAALVSDRNGKPVDGVPVVFTLPGSGASGTFATGGTTQSVATGANGVATSSPVTANLTAGTWQATATVSPVPTPARFSLTNLPSLTATHVTASSDPATPTEPVTFTATVSAATSTAGTPTGSVQFTVDGVNLGAAQALSGGSVTSIPITGLAPGTRAIEAVYAGTPEYLTSTGSLALPVEKTPTATHVTSSVNPALPTEPMTFTATITVPPGNTPYSGTVQFAVDGTPLGGPQVATNGTATSPSFDTLVVGPHAVTAVTAETTDYLGSTGTLVEVVDPDGTAVDVTSSANPAEFGAPLDLDAEVAPRPPVVLTPTGTVDFTADGNPACTGALSGGTTSCAPATPLAPGANDVVGNYSGDADFDPSSGSMVEQIIRAHTVTTVTGSPVGESVFGQAVTFDADVTRANAGTGTPTGTVQFAIDGVPIGAPVSLGSGSATSAPVTPGAGPHVVTAVYSGDTNFVGSTGTAAYRVLPAPTTIALSASPEPSQPGGPVTFTADVGALVPGSPPGVVPVGQVQFRVDGLEFGGPVALAGGQAVSGLYTAFEPGFHDVAAVYTPTSPDFDRSHTTIVHSVDEPTVTVVASSSNPALAGEAVAFLAHVGPLAPAGAISFFVDGVPITACQAVPVVENDAACVVPGLGAGVHSILAAYSGAPLYDPSLGALAQEVLAGPLPAPVAPDSSAQSGGGGTLPFTGSGLGLALMGALALAAGTVLIAATRRRLTSASGSAARPSRSRPGR